jgi:hypothetical protein
LACLEQSPFFGPRAVTKQYRVPADSGKKTGLSSALLSFFEGDGESLLWITEFGIWPSCEDRVLFDGFRRSLGESRPIQEKPGHILERGDLKHAASLLGMVLYFVWGALLVSAEGDVMVEISHDEMFEVTVRGNDGLLVAIDERITAIVS